MIDGYFTGNIGNFYNLLEGTMKLAIYLLALMTVAVSLTYHHPSSQPRLRKSIHVLNQTERKSLFWCIKMVSVMPAPAPFRNWTYVSFAKLPKDNPAITPLRVADILVSSHSSSCEHANFYFAHYHRHLMVHSEIWLNFVHQTLRGGKQRLLQLYPAEIYEQHSSYWDEIFKQYASSGAANLSFISLHYWNPTNYRQKLDIKVPIQLACPNEYPGKKIDVVDRLFHRVLGHWPWEVNVKTRLISQDYTWNQTQFQEQMENLQVFIKPQDEKEYTNDELNLLNQQLTPRRQPRGQNFTDFMMAYSEFQHPLINNHPSFYANARKHFREYFHTVGSNTTLPLGLVPEQQLYVLFGAQVQYQKQEHFLNISNQYLSKKEIKALKLNQYVVGSYNDLLPHCSLAYALFNTRYIPSFKDYLTDSQGFEKSHNQMHNYRGFFLRDPFYSIVTLFFYPYHSWIDMELEMKIRMSNHEDRMGNQSRNYNILKDFLDNGVKGEQKFRLKKLLDEEIKPEYREQAASLLTAELNQFYAMISANNQSIFPSLLDQTKVGSQLVFEWIDHFLQNKLANNQTVQTIFNAAFLMRDYMLTSSRLRTSKDLGELYRKVYVKNNGWRFEGLIDIADFPFDYDYQVYNGPRESNPTLDDSASNMPKYLREMRKDVQDTQT